MRVYGMKRDEREDKTKGMVASPPDSTLVYLPKWWLVKVNGKGLAVGGFTQRGGRVSLFCSAAIARRHGPNTLETADGLTISFSGLIDQLRTTENGFPNEVCRRFRSGFPLDWEKYMDYNLRENDEHKLHSDGFQNDLSSFSLDDAPVARIRDLMFGLGDRDNELLMKTVYDDTMKKLGEMTQGSPASGETSAEGMEVDEGVAGENKEECSGIVNEVKAGSRRSNKRFKPAAAGVSARSMRGGVSTRRMTRLKSALGNEAEESAFVTLDR